MMRASNCTLPSRFKKLPRPASKASSSSMTTTASSAASSADPPFSSTHHPAATARRVPFKCASTMSSGMAHAPPWTTRTGLRVKLDPLHQDSSV